MMEEVRSNGKSFDAETPYRGGRNKKTSKGACSIVAPSRVYQRHDLEPKDFAFTNPMSQI